MIRPVSMVVNMHHTRRRQFFSRVRMFTRDVIGVVVPGPPLLGIEVGHQQALSMVPSTPKGIIILLTLRHLLVFAETIPFTMGMLLDTLDHKRSCDHVIPRGITWSQLLLWSSVSRSIPIVNGIVSVKTSRRRRVRRIMIPFGVDGTMERACWWPTSIPRSGGPGTTTPITSRVNMRTRLKNCRLLV